MSENGNGSPSENPSPEVIGVRHGMFGATGSGDTSGYGRLVR
ncbi:MAG TPA: NADH-quinone oxidoreductase subunit C, partial [Mycobacterium sp.]|nr:NADH-quinone oxidoreductase subunit C [Mycobacterium sp.]